MSEISIIDRQEALADNRDMAGTTDNPPMYDALVALKPDEWTLNAWTVKAGVNRNFFNDLRRTGTANHGTIQKLLDVAERSLAELEARLPTPAPRREPEGSRVEDPFRVFRHGRPKDVPVMGTPSCGEVEIDGEIVESVEMDLGEVVDFVRRPPTLEGRNDVYAIYFTGFSMVPRFEPGEIAYVDARRPPSIGDYVVVQLTKQRGDDEDPRIISALVKRLVRRTADRVDLEQFNPPKTFSVPAARAGRIHRIFTLGELAGV